MKTKLVLLLILVASSLSLSAQNKLTIVVDGIENPTGNIMVGVSGKENFLKKPEITTMAPASGETVTIIIDSIQPGEYAVFLYQDENDNKKLDTGMMGIPTEKTGFSNNAKGSMGPPKYSDCKFTIDKDTTIYISFN